MAEDRGVADEEVVRAHVVVRGRVQGVFYRAIAQDHARSLGLTGWIRNRPDGNVECLLEGPRDGIEAMLAWCEKGPPHARVDGVDVKWEDTPREFTTFRVTF